MTDAVPRALSHPASTALAMSLTPMPLVTTKGLMPYGGAIGADSHLDRAGIHCRTVKDAALVLDAMKNPVRGYFDPRDLYSALPEALVSTQPYASYTAVGDTRGQKPLAGVRIGIVREYMVKHSANDVAMSDQIDEQIKSILRDQLGAELVESVDRCTRMTHPSPTWSTTSGRRLRRSCRSTCPSSYERADSKGVPLFAVPGYDVTTWDYPVSVAEGKAPLSPALNLRSISDGSPSVSFAFHIAQYLSRRGDARVKDWTSLNANAKYFNNARTVAMTNWEHKVDLVSEDLTQDIKMREVIRLVVAKAMKQNRVDVLVNPTTTIPPTRIGYASQPVVSSRTLGRFPTSANIGIPEITVPAGFNRTIYEPEFALNEARDDYVSKASDHKSTLARPRRSAFRSGLALGTSPYY